MAVQSLATLKSHGSLQADVHSSLPPEGVCFFKHHIGGGETVFETDCDINEFNLTASSQNRQEGKTRYSKPLLNLRESQKKRLAQNFLPPSPLSKTISGSRLTARVKLPLCPPTLPLLFCARSCIVLRLPCSGQMLFPPDLFLTSNGQRGLPGR